MLDVLKGLYTTVKPAIQWVQVSWSIISGTRSAASVVINTNDTVEKQKGVNSSAPNSLKYGV
ncbi:MAG: hypothetical protein ACI8ZF_000946 [Candidatus Midichloriaceae bacterium]|jgi:hypothetical protein